MAAAAAAEAVQKIATTAARTVVDLSISPTSGFTFHIETDSSIVGTAIVVGTLTLVGASLAAIYFSNSPGIATKIKDAITGAFAGKKKGRRVGRNINPGSLLFDLHCDTAESFLQFIVDYESGKVKQDLKEELLKVGIEVENITIKIKNAKEAAEHKGKLSFAGIEWRTIDGKVQIKNRESSPETTEIKEMEESTSHKEGDNTDISVHEHQGQTAIPPSSFQNLELSESKSDRKVKDCKGSLGPHGRTALHLAVIKADKEGTEDILKHLTVEINAIDKSGNTALHYACDHWTRLIALKLIEAGAETNVKNNAEETPLHIAAKKDLTEVTEKLLLRKTEVNAVDKIGNTALHYICKHGNHAELAERLIEAGAETNVKNNAEETPLHLAARKGLTEVNEKLLLHKAEVNAVDKSGNTALHYACMYGRPQLALKIIEAAAEINVKNNVKETPLHLAARRGLTEVTEKLLLHQAEVNAVDKSGNTALHYACEHGQPQVAQKLIEAGAEINIKNRVGKTPLHLTSRMGYSQIVEMLLKCNAEVNAVDIFGMTALDCCTCTTGVEKLRISFLLREAEQKRDGWITELKEQEMRQPWKLTEQETVDPSPRKLQDNLN